MSRCQYVPYIRPVSQLSKSKASNVLLVKESILELLVDLGAQVVDGFEVEDEAHGEFGRHRLIIDVVRESKDQEPVRVIVEDLRVLNLLALVEYS